MIQSDLKQILFLFFEVGVFASEVLHDVFAVETLFDAEYVVEPVVNDEHYWFFVDIAEKYGVDHFNNFLV